MTHAFQIKSSCNCQKVINKIYNNDKLDCHLQIFANLTQTSVTTLIKSLQHAINLKYENFHAADKSFSLLAYQKTCNQTDFNNLKTRIETWTFCAINCTIGSVEQVNNYIILKLKFNNTFTTKLNSLSDLGLQISPTFSICVGYLENQEFDQSIFQNLEIPVYIKPINIIIQLKKLDFTNQMYLLYSKKRDTFALEKSYQQILDSNMIF